MSVIGFDIGNESCVIATAKHGGVDVLLNNESKRETPAVVSFGDKQRFLGSVGAAFATANPKSTISQIKRLIGKLYKEVEDDLKLLPFATSEGPRGGILIELEYLKQKWTFTPVEILAMLFKHLKQITENNLETSVVDCVIGIPSYFSDLQRRMYLDAAFIAGLKHLRLMHDGTAIALGYGMYKTDFCESGQTNVMFVDIGHCDTQVTLAAFEHGGMKILSHSFDPNLGGRDFDEVLFNHFATQFKEKFKIDMNSNVRASARLRASCEKVKKVLSANAEAPLSIECLIGDTDVRGVITREEFEKLSSKLLDRVIKPCGTALKDSGLIVDKIHTVELVGSGSRIPAITKILTSFFMKEPTRTLNASECVARGCALRCAMLSPSLIVRDYKIEDSFPYAIVLPTRRGELMLFPKGSAFPNETTSPFPNEMMMKHKRKISINFQVTYIKEWDFPAGISHIVGRFGIGSSDPSDAETGNIEFGVKLNDHGIVEISCARIKEDDSYLSILKKRPNRPMLNLPFSKNMDVSTTTDELLEAEKKEKILTKQDIKVEESKDQRNTLESFVYDTRSKLSGAYQRYVTDSDKMIITKKLQVTEDWLYEDSDDEFEQDYSGRLKNLKKLLEPIEIRYNEDIAIAKATKALQDCIAKNRSHVDSQSAYKKEKVKIACTEVEKWLNGLAQKNLPPKTLLSDINRAIDALQSNCESILKSKPSLTRHEEPISDQRDQTVESSQKDQRLNSENPMAKAAKPLMTKIADYKLRAESLPAGQKDEVMKRCDIDEKWLNARFQNNVSPKILRADIIYITQNLERECEKIIRSKSSLARHKEPVESYQIFQLTTNSYRRDKPANKYKRDQSVYSPQMVQPMNPHRRNQYVGSYQKDSYNRDQKDKPMDSVQTGQPRLGPKAKGKKPVKQTKQIGLNC